MLYLGHRNQNITIKLEDGKWLRDFLISTGGDGCGAYLNDQNGFDDHKYLWKCSEYGFKSSISKDNIRWENDEA